MLEQAILAKDAADLADPNPVHWRHVFSQLEANFPNDAIEWVKRARWLGPCNVPWSRIDDDDEDEWAASHQPDAVNRFARGIASGDGNTAPSILVQEPGKNQAFIVDGHHRALARKKLGKPVLAYVGNIDPRDREAAEQTHSSQIHGGTDPANKSAQVSYLPTHHAPIDYEAILVVDDRITLAAGELHALQAANKSAETPVVSTVHHPLGPDSLWHTPDRHVSTPQRLPAYVENTALALQRDQGMGESESIATAINAVKEWAAGRAFGGHVKVTEEVQQAAQRALTEWEHLKETHHP